VGVSVTEKFLDNTAEQVPLLVPPLMLQLMPEGFDATLPLPVPASVTDTVEKLSARCVVAVDSGTNVGPVPPPAAAILAAKVAVGTLKLIGEGSGGSVAGS
jgi:hypothetical protein